MSYLGRSAKLSLKAQEKVSFLATAGQTSKTGLSYTPSFVEVYVNGVLLTDTTDFTATNGNSVTFTVALLLNDEVTVVSLKTFTVADHYNKTEADTLLAAKAPIASPSFTGTVTADALTVDGFTALTRDNNKVMTMDRLNSDGEILRFNKDGTTVGSIGAKSGAVYIGTGDAGIAFNHHGGGDLDSMMPYSVTAGAFQNGAVDIGGSVNRFKDLYLSGGVYLGGTGAANALDDYEEGTWTPTCSVGTVSNTESHYTKVGRVVHVTTRLSSFSNSSGSGQILISGLPFTCAKNETNVGYGWGNFTLRVVYAYGAENAASCSLYSGGTASYGATLYSDIGSAELLIKLEYITNS